MKKNYFKKSLSLLLVALMLMTCWVWVAPTEAEARATITTYRKADKYGTPYWDGSNIYYSTCNSGSSYTKFTWPKHIYLDVSETLQSAGYYYTVEWDYGNGTDYRIVNNGFIFGGWRMQNPSQWPASYNTMNEMFSNYDLDASTHGTQDGIDGESSTAFDLKIGNDNWDGAQVIIWRNPSNDNNAQHQYVFMKGTPNGVRTGRYSTSGAKPNSFGGWQYWSNGWKNASDKYTNSNDSGNWTTDCYEGTWKEVAFDITIYDKSALNSAIANATTIYNSNNSYTSYLKAGNWSTFTTQRTNAASLIKTRVTTTAALNTQTNNLTNATNALIFSANDSAFKTAIANAQAIINKAGYDTLYSQASRDALKVAYENATLSAYANGAPQYKATEYTTNAGSKAAADQTEINKLTNALNAAINGISRAYDIGYDNLFSLAEWALNPAKTNMANGTVEIDAQAGTIKITHDGSTADADTNTSQGAGEGWYKAPVKENTEYVLEWETSGKGRAQIHAFFATGNAWTDQTNNWFINSGDLPYSETMGKHTVTFTTPATTDGIVFRFGTCNQGDSITFSNIKLMKKADYEDYAKNYNTIRVPFFYGDTKQLDYIPVRDGYVFDGWVDGEGNKITSVANLTASDTVYASWTKMWTVTFKNWNGDVIKSVQVKNGESVQAPTDIPVRAEDETNHYTFDSWYGLPATITANVDVFATYKATAHGNFYYEQVNAPVCETNAIVDKYCGDCHYLVADNAEYEGEDETYLALGHEYGNTIDKSNNDGTHAIRCLNYRDCGSTKNVDCSYERVVKTEGADCVTQGTITKACACGHEATFTGEVDSSTHKSVITINDKAATCTAEGYTGDQYCEACDKTVKAGTIIEKLPHTWENTRNNLVSSADCFYDAVYYQECSVCHTTEEGKTWTDTGSMLEHVWEETTKYNKTQADCETDEVYYYECALCHSSSEDITGDTWTKSYAWNHNFTGEYVPNGDGTHNRKCVNEGCTKTGANDTCDYGEWTKVDADTHEHTCTLCGYTPDAVEHNWTAWTSTDATLEADGKHSRYCEDCKTVETEDCTYTRTEKAETCTEGGYTIHSCDVCDHEYRTEGAPSKGHNYIGEYKFDTATDMHQRACVNGCGTYGSGTELDKWTACEFEYTNTVDGKHLAECKFCDNEQEEDCDGGQATCPAPAVCAKCEAEYGTTSDHSFKGTAVKLEGDVHAYLCEYCGEDTGYYGIGNKINDTEPCQGGTATCSKLAECTVCGDEHGTFDEDAHKWGDWAFNGDDETKTHIRTCEYNPDHTENGDCYSPDSKVFAADCETDGYTLNTCEFCAHEWKTQIVPALDHDWSGNWVDNGDGSHTKTCQDPTCKYGENGAAKTLTEYCSKENATAKETKPTCITDGYTTYTCNDCGYVWVDDEVPATGHSYEKKIIVEKDDYKRTDRDCVTALTYWYRCDNCDVSAETEKDKYDDETVLYGVVLEAANHKFDKKDTSIEYLVSPATCYDRAVYYFSCSACGEKGTTTFESGSVLEHEWEEKETFIKSEADCVNNEVYYYQCELCDASSETITGKTWEKLGTLKGHDFDHDNDEVIGNEGDTGYTAYVAPDCDNDGIEEHYTCEVCDKMFKDAEGKTAITKITITKLGHSWEDVKYKAPTCEEDGHSAHQDCTNCDATLRKEVYPATGHNFTGAYYCDTANNYHSFLCRNNCGESGIVVDEEQVKYKVEFDGLDWTFTGGIECDFTGEYVNETDENGIHSHVLKCECGNETSAVCVDDEPATVEPDCTNDGYTLHICNTCNYEWKTDIVPALDHDVTGSATPNGNGTHSVSCAREGCDYTTTAEKCSGGTATCKDKAVCTVCGGEYGETTSHNFDEATWEYQNDAKCGVDGTEKNACTVCGEEETRVAEGTALKHELSDWIYEAKPTCKDEGKKYQECTREGCDYRTKTVTEPKNEDAHVWATDENGEIVWVYVGGDCGKGVTYKSTCTVCGKIQTEIRETDHTFITSEYGATCTTPGTIKEVCSICGYTTTREGAPATGHTLDEGTVQKKATCAQEGRMLYTCVTCGYKETQVIEKTAHGWALEGAVEGRDYIVVSAKAPTCDINGYNEHIECLHCATGLKDYEAIPATGHADNDGNGKCDECNSALYGDSGEKACGCICHKESGLMKFIYKILRFFWKLFGISQSCNCGATHY